VRLLFLALRLLAKDLPSLVSHIFLTAGLNFQGDR
jgi:hypothetical protein